VDDASAPRILVIDDDDAVRSIVAETLRGEGYRVEEARNGAVGLDQLGDVAPDLILLDVVMPVVDGYQFIERLRQEPRTVDIPIVLISATHGLPDEAKDLGVKAVLTKPFDMGMLLAIIERLMHTVKPEEP
jgi:two-component system chemotaxis response regulator CheY